eukprot:CAMPEP_0171292972 /NCGR_PEP_ID=MMETSP0816-20121228/995_1 /TAXON_ID=420281 /ORGANISM="Proboscia inermis, Strain CCAP1064/1" /LENGTH=534 /DNA_ID=CAMNT_0011763243 /DNA_START=110 /DNA_END=1714 /DNA_ORIENTATION=-
MKNTFQQQNRILALRIICISWFSCFLLPIICATNERFRNHAVRDVYVNHFIDDMDEAGYEVRIGDIEIFSEETCKLPENAFYCLGNNPGSPYAASNIPVIPGQVPFPYGTRMREDEAIVLIGVTPPLAKYFGFTFYLNNVEYNVGDSNGGYGKGIPTVIKPEDGRSHIQASLEDPINPSNMNVTSNGSYDDAFNKDFVLISSPDQNIVSTIKDQLIKLGVPESIFNVQGLSSETIDFGIEEKHDVVSPLFRMAFFDDEDDMTDYLRSIPWSLLRVTPKVMTNETIPFDRIERDVRSADATTQEYLRPSMNQLVREIKQQFKGRDGFEARSLVVDADPDKCIDERTKCFFENTDSAYFGNFPGRLFPEYGHFVVIGVNHVEAGYARYSSVTLYGAREFISVGSFTSVGDMKGSVDRYIPDDPYKDQFYAMHFKRNCTGMEYCIDVPLEGEGSMVARDTQIFMDRAYMDPNGTNGPDPAKLLPFRVIYIEEQPLSSKVSLGKERFSQIRKRLFPGKDDKNTTVQGLNVPYPPYPIE